jgi:cytoskeletal protein RodZ
VQAIGDRLREARMRQKIDIADVEAATKIRAKYLRALENEEFGLLPGPTFVKTFLRTYAEYLGLDATLLVEEYRVAHEPRGEEFRPIDPTASGVTRRRARGGGGGGGRRDRRGPRVGPPGPGAVFAVVLVLLLVVILVLGFTGDNGSKNDTTPQRAGQPDQSQAARAQEQKRKERARKKKQRAAAQRRASTVKLRLAPVEPTYACVVDGAGKLKFGGTMSTPRSFSGKRLRINLGRTSVRVTVNGKRLAIPAGSNPVGYDLRAGRKPKPLPLGQRPNC